MAETDSNERQQYLSFFVGGEEYAMSILRVREIVQLGTVTKMPAMPPMVRGAVNLRGRVVPVIDLAVRLGLPETPSTHRTCVVMTDVRCGADELVMGVLAEAVSQVIDLTPTDVKPPPNFGTRVGAEFLVGMAEIGEKFVLILESDKLLSDVQAAAIAAASQHGTSASIVEQFNAR